MKLVIDTNILLSALIKNSFTRELIIKSGVQFFYPKISFKELTKYKKYVLKKSGMTEKNYLKVLGVLMEKISLVSLDKFEDKIKEAKKLIGLIDKDEVVFLACALSLKTDIWTDDKDFKKQKKVRILTSQNMAKKFFYKNP